jgi:hypothetical protein
MAAALAGSLLLAGATTCLSPPATAHAQWMPPAGGPLPRAQLPASNFDPDGPWGPTPRLVDPDGPMGPAGNRPLTLPKLLMNTVTRQCLDIRQPVQPGSLLLHTTCNPSLATQQWQVNYVSAGGGMGGNPLNGGMATISSGAGGQCLEAGPGGLMRIAFCNSGPAQTFRIQSFQAGFFMIASLEGMCLDVFNSMQAAVPKIEQTCNPASQSQQWTQWDAIDSVSQTPPFDPRLTNTRIVPNGGRPTVIGGQPLNGANAALPAMGAPSAAAAGCAAALGLAAAWLLPGV